MSMRLCLLARLLVETWVDSPIALLLLKLNSTLCTAKVTGKKYRGRGKACSRYTGSEPDLAGK